MDAHGTVTREQLESLGQPLIQKITDACEAALSSAGMTAEKLDAVELIGGCSRTPMIESAIANALKTTPSRTLNCEECVARGAALNDAGKDDEEVYARRVVHCNLVADIERDELASPAKLSAHTQWVREQEENGSSAQGSRETRLIDAEGLEAHHALHHRLAPRSRAQPVLQGENIVVRPVVARLLENVAQLSVELRRDNRDRRPLRRVFAGLRVECGACAAFHLVADRAIVRSELCAGQRGQLAASADA